MNKKVLDNIADWELDCLLKDDFIKGYKLNKLYKKIFDRQWKHYMRWRLF